MLSINKSHPSFSRAAFFDAEQHVGVGSLETWIGSILKVVLLHSLILELSSEALSLRSDKHLISPDTVTI